MLAADPRGLAARTAGGLVASVFYLSLAAIAVVTPSVATAAEPRVAWSPEANGGQPRRSPNDDNLTLRLLSVRPTVFFVERKGGLGQVAEVAIENTSGPVEAVLDVGFPSGRRSVRLGKLQKGKSTHRVYVPDVSKPAPVEFVLKANGEVHDRQKTTWRPKRHWQVHIVPITHHDLGYTDTIGNILRQYDRFYDDVLRFCEQTDDWPEECRYRYTVEGTWSTQHFLRNRPAKTAERLGKYLREGRIEIPALFGNQVSALCSHEELIRLMYPSFQVRREHGAPIRTASITDVPGLSWGLPTVLAGAGVKYFFAGLPTYFEWGRSDVHTFWDEAAVLRHGRPDAFRWEGPDGSSVLVYYQGSYGFLGNVTGPHSYKEVMDRLPGMLDAMEKQGSPFSVARYIHNGVDNYPPDVKISHIVREWNGRWAYPRLVVATNSMFFEALETQCRDVRVFRGELPDTDYVVGATSTAKQTGINRMAHDRLHSAEKFATIGSLLGVYPRTPDRGSWISRFGDSRRPAGRISEAYDSMLLYDEHTWGMARPAGKMQDWNWADKSHFAYKAAGLADSILSGSVHAIAEEINFGAEGDYVVVFNSLSSRRTDVARVSDFSAKGPFDLIDEATGTKVPYQIVEIDSPQAPSPYSADRYGRGQFSPAELRELVFVAEEVPAMGWKAYRLVPRKDAPRFSSSLAVGERNLENGFFKVGLDAETGAIESIYDKGLSREMVDRAAPHRVNQLVARWAKTGKQQSSKNAAIRKGQDGPVCASLVVSSEGPGCPQLTQEIILYDKIKRIDLANRILKDSTPLLEVYFAFPFKIDNPRFRFEGSNSVIEPLRDQFPGSNSNYYTVQHWADASDGQVGVTLCPIESHLLEFGGLWPSYVSQAHHGVTPPDFGRAFVKPDQLTKGHMYAYVLNSNFRTNFPTVQQGDMLFRYCLTVHEGDWRAGRPRDVGWAAANPLLAVRVNGKKTGRLGKKVSFCQVDQPNVLLLTLKQAEDGDGIIVRLVETEGKGVEATLSLPHLTVKKARLTNLVEENREELTSTPHQVKAAVKPFGITTIRLQTSP